MATRTVKVDMTLPESVAGKKTKRAAISGKTISAEADIGLINQHSIKELKPEDVFVFSVVLCDSEVDRDFEQFSDSTLDGLAPLFVGKTGIFNHSWDAKDQVARIYKTGVETAGGVNSLGEPLKQLVAFAYILRNEASADVIEKVEGGILKEVSVGVAVKSAVCSICGSRMGWRRCADGHEKGQRYEDGGLCYGILNEPSDAYEFSFVTVPAQRGAGVTKSFEETGGAIDYLLSQELAPDDANRLLEHCRKSLLAEGEHLKRQEIITENEKFLKFGGN